MTCQHCQTRKRKRPRGLCCACYARPGIRCRYPVTSKYAPKRTLGRDPDFYGTAPLPSAPIVHPPGSAEKIAELAARAAAMVSLWHPADDDGPVAGRVGGGPERPPVREPRVYRVVVG